jgi:hypothetical protein
VLTGPLPKPASQRRRRNRASTATTLRALQPVAIPRLPVKKPHPLTRSFWRELWESPITPELTSVDVSGLLMLAVLVEDFHRADSVIERINVSREIRLRGAEFGLTPISRRRLQWEIARVSEAEARRAARVKSPTRPDPRLTASA